MEKMACERLATSRGAASGASEQRLSVRVGEASEAAAAGATVRIRGWPTSGSGASRVSLASCSGAALWTVGLGVQLEPNRCLEKFGFSKIGTVRFFSELGTEELYFRFLSVRFRL